MPSLAGEQLLVSTSAFEPTWASTTAAHLQTIVAKLETIFRPYNVAIVTRRPLVEAYVEVLLGGDNADRGATLRCGEQRGFATLRCGERRVVEEPGARLAHVFAACIADGPHGDTHRVAVIAHEVGHALGLEHIDQPGTLMYTHGASTAEQWGHGKVVPWNDTVGYCGRTQQDDHAVLLSRLGPARQPPVSAADIPMPDDVSAPTFERQVPLDGETMAPGSQPCVRAADESGLGGDIQMELYVPVGGALAGHAVRQWIAHGPGPTFVGPAVPRQGPAMLRIIATDAHGNVREERVRFSIEANAPTRMCL